MRTRVIRCEIEMGHLDHTRLCYNGLGFDSVNQRFPERNLFNARIVEAVDVIPDYDRHQWVMDVGYGSTNN